MVLTVALQGARSAPVAAQSPSPDGAAAKLSSERPDAAELNERGLSLYSAQDYRHALESFIGAYSLENDPNLLFNMGRCYEQLHELDAALEKYQQFVDSPESDAS